MSLAGYGELPQEEEAFRDLCTNHNILSIASSGNDGSSPRSFLDRFWIWYDRRASVSLPAAYPTVLSVGAVDWRKQIAAFSTFNPKVNVAAPGVAVWSALPTNDDCLYCQIYPNSEYGQLSGTSMAAPHVAGAAALLWSYDLNAGADFIRNALLVSAEDLGEPGRDDNHGYGLVQTRAAFDVLTATLDGDRELQDFPDGNRLCAV